MIDAANSLYNSGDDALQNLWVGYFQELPAKVAQIGDLTSEKVRITKVSYTEGEINTVPVTHMGVSLDIPVVNLGTNQEFTFDIRIDKNWKVYQTLVKWQKSMLTESTYYVKQGAYINYRKKSIFKIARLDYNLEEIENSSIYYYGAYPRKFSELPFGYDSNDPVVVTVTMGYVYSLDELRTA